jgi:hypothetical protein
MVSAAAMGGRIASAMFRWGGRIVSTAAMVTVVSAFTTAVIRGRIVTAVIAVIITAVMIGRRNRPMIWRRWRCVRRVRRVRTVVRRWWVRRIWRVRIVRRRLRLRIISALAITVGNGSHAARKLTEHIIRVAVFKTVTALAPLKRRVAITVSHCGLTGCYIAVGSRRITSCLTIRAWRPSIISVRILCESCGARKQQHEGAKPSR